jgi:hypothetical protein
MCRDEWSAVGNHFAGEAVWMLATRNVSAASDSQPAIQKLRSREAGIATARENVAGISVNMCQGRAGDSAVTTAATVRSEHLISCLFAWGGVRKKDVFCCPARKLRTRFVAVTVATLQIRDFRLHPDATSPLFWDVTRVVSYRRFGTIFRSHLQGSNSPTSGTNYQSTLHNVQKRKSE